MANNLQKNWTRIGRTINQSWQGVLAVIKRPEYIFLAIILGFLISTIIYLSINFGFYGSLLLAPMGLVAKMTVLGSMLGEMFTSYFTTTTGVVLLVLSILQGVAMSLVVYNLKQNRKVETKVMTGSGIAAVAMVIGLGCVPCGTSILVPIMTIIFASSAPALLSTANLIILLLAILLTIYSIYTVGRVSYTNYQLELSKSSQLKKEEQKNEAE